MSNKKESLDTVFDFKKSTSKLKDYDVHVQYSIKTQYVKYVFKVSFYLMHSHMQEISILVQYYRSWDIHVFSNQGRAKYNFAKFL